MQNAWKRCETLTKLQPENLNGRDCLGSLGEGGKINTGVDFKETAFEGVGRNRLAQDMTQQRTLVNTVMNRQGP